MRSLETIICALLFIHCSQVNAQSNQPLTVQDSATYRITGNHIETYVGQRVDPQLKKGEDLFAQGKFKPIVGDTPDYGVTDAGIWLKFSLLNSSINESLWVLDTGVPFLRLIKVWAVSGDTVKSVLSDGRTTRFHDRKQQQRMLISEEFSLVPGMEMDIWVYFESDSTSAIPLRIYPSSDVYKTAVETDVPLIVFYTIALVFLAFVVAFAFALSSKVAFYYAGFFGCVLAYNAQLTGNLFVYLWPEFPQWNALASHPFGMGAIVFALLMGREFIKSGLQRRSLRLLVLFVTVFSAIYIFAPLVLPLVTTKKLAGPIVLTFLVLQFVLAIVAFRDKKAGSLFYVLGALTLFGYIGLFTALTQGHIKIDSANREMMLRYGQLVDGFIFCVAIVRQTWLLRNDARQARKSADASSLELATTRHDLRQPLHSLKLALESTSQSSGNDKSDRIRESLEYLEALVQNPPAQNTGVQNCFESKQEQNKPLELTHLLHNLEIMFAEEASSKRIDLTIVKSSLMVEAQSVHLLRVLANLLSNVISHSGGTRVLLGVRRKGEFVSFHCIDNGEGIDPVQFDNLKKEFVKSDSSSGEGLGLNIISQICDSNSWRFLLANDGKRGSHFIVSNVRKYDTDALSQDAHIA